MASVGANSVIAPRIESPQGNVRSVWAAVLFFGLGTAIDPLRLGLTALVISRPRPLLNLFAFWLGGMTAGIGLATAVLLVMRDVALGAIRDAAALVEDFRSSVVIFSGGRLQITLGVFALLFALILAAREKSRVPVPAGAGPVLAPEPSAPNAFARLSTRFHGMLERGFVWGAFAVGLGSATPPVECLLVLTIIMASGAAAGAQVSAFVAFTLLVLVLVEIPLVAYLAVPQKTEAVVAVVDRWIRAHRRQITQTMLVVAGIAFIVQGVTKL